MARASILTLDARTGGVPLVAKAVYDLLIRSGHTPTLVYRATEDLAGLDRSHALRYLLSTRPVRTTSVNGMRARAVVAYPAPPRHQYLTTRLARSAIRAPIVAVVSGSSHAGLPRALLRRPFVLWVATLYGDELQSRADAGDGWAAGLLGSRDWPILEAQEQLVYERASVILAASSHTRDRIAARWPQVASRLRHVFYPVDAAHFRPPAAPAAEPTVLLTARIQDPRKNVDLLVRACARARAACPALQLVLAGDEPTAGVRALVDRLGLGAAIRFAGYVDRATLLSLYQQAGIFVLPSRQEGLCISVQEAMACGLPVVSTRCGGPECLVDHGKTGLLVANDDEHALASAIVELIGHSDRRRAMGLAARERCLQQFSTERVEVELHSAFTAAFGRAFTQAGDMTAAG